MAAAIAIWKSRRPMPSIGGLFFEYFFPDVTESPWQKDSREPKDFFFPAPGRDKPF